MGAYAYLAPQSVAEVVAVLSDHVQDGKRAQLLSGGTDLMVQMRSADYAPCTIVDIKKLAETNRLEIGADEIYIGEPENIVTAFMRCDRGDEYADHHTLLCVGLGELGFDLRPLRQVAGFQEADAADLPCTRVDGIVDDAMGVALGLEGFLEVGLVVGDRRFDEEIR